MAIKQKRILRVPKVYNPAPEKDKMVLPKIIRNLSILTILFLLLIYWIFLSSFFKIKETEIIGTQSEEITQVVNRCKGSNIFLINTKKIESELLSKNPQFLSVKIDRGIPYTLRVKFQHREPKIIWQTADRYYLVDQEAIAFEQTNQAEGYPIVLDNNNLDVRIPSRIATSKFVDFIKNANASFKDYNLQINRFEINETTFQTDGITDGFKIIFDTVRPFSEQMEAFKKVYEEHRSEITEYIDLRVEGRVYYK